MLHSEKAMAPHSSILAWQIPWTEEPRRLQSMGLLGVRHDWATSLSLFTFHFYALEKEMATHSSFLPGESQGRGSLVGCRLWGRRVGHDWSDIAAAAAAAAAAACYTKGNWLIKILGILYFLFLLSILVVFLEEFIISCHNNYQSY